MRYQFRCNDRTYVQVKKLCDKLMVDKDELFDIVIRRYYQHVMRDFPQYGHTRKRRVKKGVNNHGEVRHCISFYHSPELWDIIYDIHSDTGMGLALIVEKAIRAYYLLTFNEDPLSIDIPHVEEEDEFCNNSRPYNYRFVCDDHKMQQIIELSERFHISKSSVLRRAVGAAYRYVSGGDMLLPRDRILYFRGGNRENSVTFRYGEDVKFKFNILISSSDYTKNDILNEGIDLLYEQESDVIVSF